MSKILILSRGYVARSLGGLIPGSVLVSRAEADYLEENAFNGLIAQIRPTLIVSAYGYTGKPNVEACEVNREECFQRNVTDTVQIARLCAAADVPLAYVGSGCIYDGGHFAETDAPNFTGSYYSYTKKVAEEELAGVCPYILRIRMPFGGVDDRKDYLAKLRAYPVLLRERNSISFLPDVARFIVALDEKRPAEGVYNVTAPEPPTPFEICQTIGIDTASKAFKHSSDLGFAVPRSNCTLATEKAQGVIQLRTTAEALKLTL